MASHTEVFPQPQLADTIPETTHPDTPVSSPDVEAPSDTRRELGSITLEAAEPLANPTRAVIAPPHARSASDGPISPAQANTAADAAHNDLPRPRSSPAPPEKLPPLTPAQAAYCKWWYAYLRSRPRDSFDPETVNHGTEQRFAYQLYDLIVERVRSSAPAHFRTITNRQVMTYNIDSYYLSFPPKPEINAREDRRRHEFQDRHLLLVQQHEPFRPELRALMAIIRAFYEHAQRQHPHNPRYLLHATRAAFALATAYGMTLQPLRTEKAQP